MMASRIYLMVELQGVLSGCMYLALLYLCFSLEVWTYRHKIQSPNRPQ